MTRIVTVGAAQLGPNQRADSRKDIVKRLLSLLEQGARHGCNLVVFPELDSRPFSLDGSLSLRLSSTLSLKPACQGPIHKYCSTPRANLRLDFI